MKLIGQSRAYGSFPHGLQVLAMLHPLSLLKNKSSLIHPKQFVCIFPLSLPILGTVAYFQWVIPVDGNGPILIAMGGFLAAAYVFLQHAYVIADITYLVPMSFTRLIAGAAIGMIFFSEWPTIWTWVGSFFILLATISLTKHEVQKLKETQPEKLPEPA